MATRGWHRENRGGFVSGCDAALLESRIRGFGLAHAVVSCDDVMQRVEDAQRHLAFREEVPLLFHADSPGDCACSGMNAHVSRLNRSVQCVAHYHGGGAGARVK